jgi:hypothetical protein
MSFQTAPVPRILMRMYTDALATFRTACLWAAPTWSLTHTPLSQAQHSQTKAAAHRWQSCKPTKKGPWPHIRAAPPNQEGPLATHSSGTAQPRRALGHTFERHRPTPAVQQARGRPSQHCNGCGLVYKGYLWVAVSCATNTLITNTQGAR